MYEEMISLFMSYAAGWGKNSGEKKIQRKKTKMRDTRRERGTTREFHPKMDAIIENRTDWINIGWTSSIQLRIGFCLQRKKKTSEFRRPHNVRVSREIPQHEECRCPGSATKSTGQSLDTNSDENGHHQTCVHSQFINFRFLKRRQRRMSATIDNHSKAKNSFLILLRQPYDLGAQ